MNKKKCAIRDNCIPNWHKKSRKLIYDNSGPCVEYCFKTEKFKYEYENKCYPSCPEGTTSIYNNNFLCEMFNDIKYKQFLNNTNNFAQVTDIKTNEIIEIVETTKNIKAISTDINDNTNDNNEIIEVITNIDNADKKNKSDMSEICRSNDFFENKCRPNKNKNMVEIIREDINEGIMNNEIDDIIRNKIDLYTIDDDTVTTI